MKRIKIGELKGITNIGLKEDRERYLSKGLAVEIIPKDNSYINAGIYTRSRTKTGYNI